MSTIDQIAAHHDEMTAWRRNLHAYPETAFEETRASDFVAMKLESFGIPSRSTVHVTTLMMMYYPLEPVIGPGWLRL